VLIAQLYPFEQEPITASNINQLSPDRFKDFWRWFRKFYKFLPGNTASDRANEFFGPRPPRRKCRGIALATRYRKARQIVASPWPFADALFLQRDMVDGSGHSAIQGASVLATRKP
jgi:hypothetical protein